MTDSKADRVFAILETAVVDGARCPTNETIAARLQSEGLAVSRGTIPGIVSQLARDGRIAIRLYGHNWREVVICSGRLRGKATQPPPEEGGLWRVMGSLDASAAELGALPQAEVASISLTRGGRNASTRGDTEATLVGEPDR